MNNLDKQLNLHNIEKKLDTIIRDEKKSDYEKKIYIESDIIIPLLDELDALKEKLKKAEKEVSDAGWEREAAREQAWLERGDDGCDWMRMP